MEQAGYESIDDVDRPAIVGHLHRLKEGGKSAQDRVEAYLIDSFISSVSSTGKSHDPRSDCPFRIAET